MKKLLAGLIVGFMIGAAGTALAANDVVQAKFSKYFLKINDRESVEIEPLVYKGTTYLPVREVAELFGYDVTYKADSRTIELRKPENESKEVEKMLENPVVTNAFIGEIIELEGAKIKVNGISYEKRFKELAAASKRQLAVLDLDIWFDSNEPANLRYPPTQSKSYVKAWILSTNAETTTGYPTSDSETIAPDQWNNVTFTLQIKEDEQVSAVTLVSPFNRNQLAVVQFN